MTLELIEQRLTALEEEVSALKRRAEGPPLSADHPTRENGQGNAAAGPHPWSQDAGYLRGDPMLDAWQKAMEEYRRRLDQDPDAL